MNVVVAETLRVCPRLSIAVTDENGTSVGPSIKFLSVRGRPQEMSLTARFGGSTLFEFSETSPELTMRRSSTARSSRSASATTNSTSSTSVRSISNPASACEHPSDSRPARFFKFYQVRSDESGITLSPDNVDTLVSAGAVADYDDRNSRKDTSSGWWNSADALWRMGTGGYATMDIDVRRYQRLAHRHVLVATSLLTLQSGGTDVVPSYTDFSLGGSNTVSGWGFNARRGKNQFINSMEYRYTALETRAFRVFGIGLYAGLALAAFGDAGTAWSESKTSPTVSSEGEASGCDSSSLRQHDPAGFRPRGWQPHAHFGINEKSVAQRNRVR